MNQYKHILLFIVFILKIIGKDTENKESKNDKEIKDDNKKEMNRKENEKKEIEDLEERILSVDDYAEIRPILKKGSFLNANTLNLSEGEKFEEENVFKTHKCNGEGFVLFNEKREYLKIENGELKFQPTTPKEHWHIELKRSTSDKSIFYIKFNDECLYYNKNEEISAKKCNDIKDQDEEAGFYVKLVTPRDKEISCEMRSRDSQGMREERMNDSPEGEEYFHEKYDLKDDRRRRDRDERVNERDGDRPKDGERNDRDRERDRPRNRDDDRPRDKEDEYDQKLKELNDKQKRLDDLIEEQKKKNDVNGKDRNDDDKGRNNNSGNRNYNDNSRSNLNPSSSIIATIQKLEDLVKELNKTKRSELNEKNKDDNLIGGIKELFSNKLVERKENKKDQLREHSRKYDHYNRIKHDNNYLYDANSGCGDIYEL